MTPFSGPENQTPTTKRHSLGREDNLSSSGGGLEVSGVFSCFVFWTFVFLLFPLVVLLLSSCCPLFLVVFGVFLAVWGGGGGRYIVFFLFLCVCACAYACFCVSVCVCVCVCVSLLS